MFPIPFNFPFRKANGDISTIGAEISAGGGGSAVDQTARNRANDAYALAETANTTANTANTTANTANTTATNANTTATNANNKADNAFKVMGVMGAKNLLNIDDFILNKSTARTKSFTTDDFGVNIPKKQVIISFKVSNSNLTKMGSFRAYGPLSSGVRPLLGDIDIKDNGDYNFSFDASDLDQLYIFINNEDDASATCKISNIMMRLSDDTDTTYQTYAKSNKELTEDVTTLQNNLQKRLNWTLDTDIATTIVNNWNSLPKSVPFMLDVYASGHNIVSGYIYPDGNYGFVTATTLGVASSYLIQKYDGTYSKYKMDYQTI